MTDVRLDLAEELYRDGPFRIPGMPFHHSAPSLYAKAMDALDLDADRPLSFLCIGSGTGYFCCAMAHRLGDRCRLIHGVEIEPELVEFSREAIQRHIAGLVPSQTAYFRRPDIFEGNAFAIDPRRNIQ